MGFAEIAASLHALTGNYVRFELSEERQTAFEKRKEALTTLPLLVMPSDEEQYILDTDASETSIGDILSQVQNEKEKVIANASCTYNKPE